jgi:hypothetical protein
MGWKARHLNVACTSKVAIDYGLGQELASRVVGRARYGNTIYAAIRSADGSEVFGLVMLIKRRNGILFTKPIIEDMGPAEDGCPSRILDLLTAPRTENARDWRRRCRSRIANAASPL